MAQCTDIHALKNDAAACFRPYNTQKHNVDRSDQKLFSGINIEILRAYCSSYLDAMQCVSRLLTGCPASSQREVEETLVSYNGIQEELTDLCTTQRLYELYSQHMGCFSSRGEKSEWCYKSKLNNTVQNIYSTPSEEFCSQVRDATFCIENNIRQGCGEQAKELVHLLVKPTISGSAQCKYNIVQEATPQTMKTEDSSGGNGQPKERATSSQSQNSNSAANISANFILILITIYLSFVTYLLKPRGLS